MPSPVEEGVVGVEGGIAAEDGGLVSLRTEVGTVVEKPLGRLRYRQVVEAVPWRAVRSRRGERHHSGLYWCATMGRHVVYESRLELARLMLADFDPNVVAIAAQPFLIRVRVDSKARRHVPDFLLVTADHQVSVVNVKPAERLADPQVAAALAWPAALFEAHGWSHEIWTGDDPVLLANVRFLAGQRRPEVLDAALVREVFDAAGDGITIRDLLGRLSGAVEPWRAKPAIVRLLWQHRLTADLRRPLDGGSVLAVSR